MTFLASSPARGLARAISRPARAGTAVVAGALAIVACGTASSAAPAGSTAAPATFQVVSMTFVSDQQGFALGTVPCGPGRCLALLGTADGGASWRRLTAPTRAAGAVYDTCPRGQPCVQQVRFATPSIGYAFGPSLLVTTDGGSHWQQVKGAGASSLEAANGTAVRVSSGTMGCAGQPYRVQSAPIGTIAWRALPAPRILMICPPVLYRQGDRLVLVGYGNPAGGVRATAQIDRSGDGGRTWSGGPDSCGGPDGYASGVALAPPDVLVMLCQHQMPGPSGGFRPAWIRVSTDGGATFGQDQMVPGPASEPGGTIIRYQIAAASVGRVLIAETGTQSGKILLTENGGHTWSVSLSTSGSQTVLLVGYQDPVTARVAKADAVWTTRDGGRTWTVDHFGG